MNRFCHPGRELLLLFSYSLIASLGYSPPAVGTVQYVQCLLNVGTLHIICSLVLAAFLLIGREGGRGSGDSLCRR